MMNPQSEAVLLLTSYFSRSDGGVDAKPLTPSEWGRFAFWLRERGRSPADLLGSDVSAVLAGWRDGKITAQRIGALLQRGHAMALAMEKWSRAGIWVLTRSDAAYPRLLKQRLKEVAPAALYGCGNRSLLNAAGIAVVGSRRPGDQDLADAKTLGGRLALGGFSVISGCAEGVDETAMQGALEQGGTAVGVMADSLFRAAASRKWRDGLMSGDLALVTPYYPEAAFSPGNAMGRNKHIYCLSRAAVVVRSGDKGGTWSGAEENIKKSWVPLWVKPTADGEAANSSLVELGARWLPTPVNELEPALLGGELGLPTGSLEGMGQQIGGSRVADELDDYVDSIPPPDGDAALDVSEPGAAAPLGDLDADAEGPAATAELGAVVSEGGAGAETESEADSEVVAEHMAAMPDPVNVTQQAQQVGVEGLTFYDLFLLKIEIHHLEFTAADIAEAWSLPRKLVEEWLNRAVEQKVIVQASKRPARYRVASSDLISG